MDNASVCEKCGKELESESRHIVGIEPKDTGGYSLKYQHILICPRLRGFLGSLRCGHTREATIEYD